MSAVPPLPKVRNPRTHALIRRETFWQITTPLAITLLAVIGVLAVVVLGAAGRLAAPTRPLADIALMFLIVLAFVAGFFMLAVGVVVAVGLAYGLRELPFLFKRVQDFLWVVAQQTRSMTQRVDNRIVGVHISLAAVRSLVHSFQALFAPWRTK